MITFTDSDKKIIKDAYKMILLHLKDYLHQYGVNNEIEYLKIILYMLHSGLFSVKGTMKFDSKYDYLNFPPDISQGVQVMDGIACCRHATEFLYDILLLLNFNPSLMHIWIDYNTGLWHEVDPAKEKKNHVVIALNDKYIIDPANKFILQRQKNNELILIDSEYVNRLETYKDDNIYMVGRVLEKYYTCKKLGIKNVYF